MFTCVLSGARKVKGLEGGRVPEAVAKTGLSVWGGCARWFHCFVGRRLFCIVEHVFVELVSFQDVENEMTDDCLDWSKCCRKLRVNQGHWRGTT